MDLLLDTQALVLWLKGEGLSHKVQRNILLSRSNVWVSIICPWEFVLKPRFQLIGLTLEHLWKGIEELGAKILPIRREHIRKLDCLPFFDEHRDPFDRILIAQALEEELTVISGDRRFNLYTGLKTLW